VNFLDLTLSISDEGELSTRVYEKPENLYLYLPPHSAHPPGMIRGLVTGQIKRYVRLHTDRHACLEVIRKFYARLRVRGFQPQVLRPLFESAYKAALASPPPSQWLYPDYLTDTEPDHRIFLHLKYNPGDPPQSAFRELLSKSILHPEGEPPLDEVKYVGTTKVEINRVTIAYHRPPNLRAKLFMRRFKAPVDSPVSAVADTLEL